MKNLARILTLILTISPIATYAKKDDIADWIKRTEIELDVREGSKPEYSILTVQPLYQTRGNEKRNTFFNQARLASANDGQTTLNYGIGYRRLLLDKKLIIGVNSFFDYEFEQNHQRIGGGLELISSAFELNSNIYEGISNTRNVNGIKAKVLDGYDVELASQVPYLPWAKIFARRADWNMTTSGVKDITTRRYALSLTPFPFIEIEAGQDREGANGKANFVETRFSFSFGEKHNAINDLVDSKAFRMGGDMSDELLRKVRRENTVRVEQVTGVKAQISISRD